MGGYGSYVLDDDRHARSPDPGGRRGTSTFRQAVAASTGLGRLAASRILGSAGEGIHQAALAGVVLFAPEAAGDPVAIVAAFAVLVLPYSLIGPFASAALDRWDRRLVIFYAGLARAVIVAVTIVAALAGALSSAGGLAAVFALTLVALGLGRLINTGLTAALPHVVPTGWVAVANSTLVTTGSLAAASGAVVSLFVVGLVEAQLAAVAWTLAIALLAGLVGAAVVLSLPRQHLGPELQVSADAESGYWVGSAYRAFAGGLATGVRAAARAPLVGVALTGIGLCRAAFGITTLAIVLLFRAMDGPMIVGMGGFSLVMAVFTAGMGLAAVAVPWALSRTDGFVIVACGAGMAMLALLVASGVYSPAVFVGCALPLGMGFQMVKLVGDHAMQTLVPDDRLGGVVALQDAVFNASFVAGMAAIAWWIPVDRVPPGVLFAACGLYLLTAVFAVVSRRRAG